MSFEVESNVVRNRDGEDVNHNVLYSNYGPVLLLDILSNTALVYRYAGYVFGVEQEKPLETIEQVKSNPSSMQQPCTIRQDAAAHNSSMRTCT